MFKEQQQLRKYCQEVFEKVLKFNKNSKNLNNNKQKYGEALT